MMHLLFIALQRYRQNIQTINTTKRTNELIEENMNGSDVSHEQFINVIFSDKVLSPLFK